VNKLLLHGCCAECTIKFLGAIKGNEEIDEVAVFFYNPNIHPRSEYQSRLVAIKKVLEEKRVRLIVPDWRPKEYFEVVKNNKNRCKCCWLLRINKTWEWAVSSGFEQFSTTLLASQYQNRKVIEEMGNEVGKKGDSRFFVPKKIDQDLKTSGFYKQFFCGCVYSMQERFEEKYK